MIPVLITGTIEKPEIGANDELAVAVNGSIASVGRGFRVGDEQRFSFLVPPTAFREGFNRVELFLIQGTASMPCLIHLGQSSGAEQ